MTKKIFLSISACLCFILGFYITHDPSANKREKKGEDHAQEMFEWWYSQRALPFDYIPAGAFQKAVLYAKTKMRKEKQTFSASGDPQQWVSIGPNNVGGRMLSLAVNPQNTNIVWAGSASGGLWKSTTGGEGASAWTYVNTGFNALSISTIAIDPASPNNMYIGTGEVSFYHSGQVGTPGARSSYGIGILRSTDGGSSWSQTDLTWTLPQFTAVEKIIINPLNTNTLYAATSEGVYKSADAGLHWVKVSTHLMAMDILMDPDDTSSVYAAHGNLNSTSDPGLYKSIDAGATWNKLTNGLPSSNFGRTSLALSPTVSFVVYAGIADGNSGSIIGLYKSVDAGASWSLSNSTNYVAGQGWYDNVIAANPHTPESLYCAGLDIYLSTDNGDTLKRKSDWGAGFMGTVPAGGPEGQDWYAHADHHAIAFDPISTKTIYFGCDGGVFKTTDGGNTFFGCNGGLVTTQFYNGFANSSYDSTIALGGLQDNGAVKYEGSTTWNKVDGGDGGWNAIDRTNQNIMYEEYIYLTISRSNSGGASWRSITNGIVGAGSSTAANFIAPFAISYSTPSILYAGAKILYKTTDRGDNWVPTNNGVALNGTKISCIGVSYTDPNTLMAGTGSSASQSPTFAVFATTNGGQTWQNVSTGLPNRYPTDIEFDPTDSKIAYVTFSGYGTGHLFRTTNLGQTWTNISSGVDIPHQSVVVDSLDPIQVYVGTDLGVYHSSNSGATWEDFSAGMIPAMVLDVGISRANGVLRAATFGNGVFQRKLYRPPVVSLTTPHGGEAYGGGETIAIQWTEKFISTVKLEYSLDSGASWNLIADNITASTLSYLWTVPNIATTQGIIRISDASAGQPVDLSDQPFSIVQDPDVYGGWNLLSVHLLVSDGQKTTLFPGATSSAFTYNSSYVVSDTLYPGIGYWLKFDGAQKTTYTGDLILTDTIPVTSGWNMIGALSAPIAASSITSVPPGIISSSFFGFNSAYFVADSLRPRGGYWINVNGNGNLILNSGTAGEAKSDAARAPSSFNSMTIGDASGRKQSLYFTSSELNPRQYEMPPLPPDGVFDVRFQTQRYVEAIAPKSRSILPILLQGVRYPLTISWNISETAINEVTLQTTVNSITMAGSSTITIDERSAKKLTLEVHSGERREVPTTFVLEQNYPNPFNPTTNFRFSILDFGLVTLRVYDMLGRDVATLLNEVKEPGEYTVSWDATNMPSGVYFYRLEAGSFLQTRKMLMIK